jgi:hypothetical protein
MAQIYHKTAMFQTFRSVTDNHVFVVCLADKFYEIVPDDVRKQGPWQGQHRGEVANLNTQYLIDIEEQGYALVRCEAAVFKPEA